MVMWISGTHVAPGQSLRFPVDPIMSASVRRDFDGLSGRNGTIAAAKAAAPGSAGC
jgi:hypothetical protein